MVWNNVFSIPLLLLLQAFATYLSAVVFVFGRYCCCHYCDLLLLFLWILIMASVNLHVAPLHWSNSRLLGWRYISVHTIIPCGVTLFIFNSSHWNVYSNKLVRIAQIYSNAQIHSQQDLAISEIWIICMSMSFCWTPAELENICINSQISCDSHSLPFLHNYTHTYDTNHIPFISHI